MTQQALAAKAGLANSVIGRLEQGHAKEPTIQTVMAIAAALDMSLDELLGTALEPGNLPALEELDAIVTLTPAERRQLAAVAAAADGRLTSRDLHVILGVLRGIYAAQRVTAVAEINRRIDHDD